MSRKNGNWGYFTYPMALTALVIALYLGGTSIWQMVQQDQNDQAALAAIDAKNAATLAELRSMPTTTVVIPLGPKGYISYYWGQSGLSHKYSLDEYKSAVIPVSKGANVDAPVEGDRFQVPVATK